MRMAGMQILDMS